MKDLAIMIVGVGGQGSLLASKLLGRLFMDAGLDVKVSEVHGMSQRGGSVVTYVKCGKKVYSPIIEEGQADIIISFEQLEAARWLPCLKKGGIIIMNTQTIMPMPVITGRAAYPEDIQEKLKECDIRLFTADALSLAKQVGSEKATNTVLLGVAARFSDIPKDKWIEAVKNTVPQKLLSLNLRAFELGYNL
ncbi:MAG: indolepyruvate oxidoreductase subunit beta [Firmicutes bacterium ADurb.Bin300]|nr:MAG: indolepyruvate oxidoreductase subunit beta [Firmicutes bacterium ADurb.Bin300]